MAVNILVVDDELEIREMICNALSKFDYDTDSAGSYIEAADLLQENEYLLVITDKNMPGREGGQEGGMELLEFIKNNYPSTEVIIITGYATIDSALYAMKNGAFDYVMKPFRIENLQNKVQKLLDYHSFINIEDTLPVYKNIQQKMIGFLDSHPMLNEEDKQALLNKLVEINDFFFRTLKTRERVILEQREALANVSNYLEQIKDHDIKDDEIMDLIKKALDESNRRL
ncbi:MAG: response regulator [bacterium]|nr:response regulator [bacterium]